MRTLLTVTASGLAFFAVVANVLAVVALPDRADSDSCALVGAACACGALAVYAMRWIEADHT